MSTPPWAPRRSSRGAAPLVLRYGIVAWSVAIVCWLAAGILTQQLHGPIAFTTDSSSFTPYLDADSQLHIDTQVTTSPVSTGLAVLFYGVLSVLWAALVAFVARGANWARITQTVLGAIGGVVVVMQAVWSLRGSGPGAVLPGWLDLVALLAIAVAILAMYLPAANAHFAAGRPPPAPPLVHTPRAPRTPLPPRPVVVTRAAWLFGCAAGLGIVSAVVQALLSVALTGATVGGLTFALAVQALMIVFVVRGASWARILETVVVASSVLWLPFVLVRTGSLTSALIVSRALGVPVLALEIVAVVLLYRPAANAFFTAAATVPPLRPDQS